MNKKLLYKIEYYFNDILDNLNQRLKLLKKATDYSSLSTKLKSELISNMLESSFSDIVENTIAPKVDHAPDLIVDDNPLEIKTSKTTTTWRGGEFSKRPSDYLLVSYDDSSDDLKLFAIFVYLNESDWKSSSSNSYYATTIDLDSILVKECKILIGSTVKKKIKTHAVAENLSYTYKSSLLV